MGMAWDFCHGFMGCQRAVIASCHFHMRTAMICHGTPIASWHCHATTVGVPDDLDCHGTTMCFPWDCHGFLDPSCEYSTIDTTEGHGSP